MSRLFKLASQYRSKLVTAYSKAYAELLELNNLAQSLPVDVYGEKDPTVVSGLHDIAKSVGVAANKAYREGITSSELNYLMGKAKTKAMLLQSLKLDEGSKSELAKFFDKLQMFQPVDVPAQVPSFKAETPAAKAPSGESEGFSEYTPPAPSDSGESEGFSEYTPPAPSDSGESEGFSEYTPPAPSDSD